MGHTNISMMVVVIRKHDQQKIGVLTSTKVNETGMQHILERPNSPLALLVRLRMVCGTEVQSGTQFLVKSLLKPGSKAHIPF